MAWRTVELQAKEPRVSPGPKSRPGRSYTPLSTAMRCASAAWVNAA